MAFMRATQSGSRLLRAWVGCEASSSWEQFQEHAEVQSMRDSVTKPVYFYPALILFHPEVAEPCAFSCE